jgi:hypothetical protein
MGGTIGGTYKLTISDQMGYPLAPSPLYFWMAMSSKVKGAEYEYSRTIDFLSRGDPRPMKRQQFRILLSNGSSRRGLFFG